MSVVLRIQRLYAPDKRNDVIRHDINVDHRSILDPNVREDKIPGNDHVDPSYQNPDPTPLESIRESYYFKPDMHFRTNDTHHPEKDKIPPDRDYSLFRLEDDDHDQENVLDPDATDDFAKADAVAVFDESQVNSANIRYALAGGPIPVAKPKRSVPIAEAVTAKRVPTLPVIHALPTNEAWYPSNYPEYYQGHLNEAAMKAKQRNALDDDQFGLPRLRAYPLNDAKHVKAAIRMFHHCTDPEDKKTLANNIFRAMKKHNVDMKIGSGNPLWHYAPENLRESAYPHLGIEDTDVPMKDRTREQIVKEHLRVNSDFYNNAFYGVEHAHCIEELNDLGFMDVFYPNVRSMAFGNRVHTCIGGSYQPNATAGNYDPNRNWFHVDLSKDTDHRDYCVRLYDIMGRMLNDADFDPKGLSPDEMGVLTDWYQRVSYHYGLLKDTDSETTRRREIQYLWDLFWNYNENPDDHHVRSINIIAFISQMRSIAIKGKAIAMNEDQIVGRQELSRYLEKELGDADAIYLLPKTKEFPIIDQLSVHLAMDKIGAVPADRRNEFARNLNRRYRELGCTFHITVDHPFAKYAEQDGPIVDHMDHVLMEDSSLPIDDRSHSDEEKAERNAQPYYKRSDYIPGSNWHNILDNKEMGPNNLKQQRPDYTAGEALL